MQKFGRIGYFSIFTTIMLILTSTILTGEVGITTVSISPASQIVGAGDSFTIDVNCVPSQAIKAYELSITFDESLVNAVSVTEGDIFDGYTTFFNSGTIDNDDGLITEVFGLIIGAGNVTDPGTLVEINFVSLDDTGLSSLNIFDVGLTNETTYITISTTNGTVQVDATAPTIVDNSPSHGHTGDSFVFNASVTDNIDSSNELTVKVDWTHGSNSGNNSMTLAGSNYFTKTVTLDDDSTSNLTYKFYAVDTYGNSYTSSLKSILVTDNDAPSISSVTTSPSTQSIGGYVNISAVVTDNIGIGDVYLYITYPDTSIQNFSITANHTGSTYYSNKTYSSIGTYSVHIWADDTSNNFATSSSYSFIIRDLNCPVISNILATTSDPIDTSSAFGWINISANVTDNIAVDSVSLIVTKPNSDSVNVSMTHGLGNKYYYYSNNVFSSYGNYSYYIWADDSTNNSVESSDYNLGIPPNWDINMDGVCSIIDLISISNVYNDSDDYGWIREDVDNNGIIEVIDLVNVSNFHGESWWD